MPKPARRVYCNRTLNLRAISAIGFDMDYTLIHYRADVWEEAAYQQLRSTLAERGWPVESLRFDPGSVILGLVLDLEHGNLVKADRFGYVKQASHGTSELEFEQRRELYGRSLVDLRAPRWAFANTLFSMSEACMYAQLVDLLDAGRLAGVQGYAALYRIVRSSLDQAHMEGALKSRIMAKPEDYVVLDPELPLALQDMAQAGKKLLLITNSEWSYTQAMMAYAFDRYLGGDSWRKLFDLIVVQARKPKFFTGGQPFFEVVDEAGHLLPHQGALTSDKVYLGGDAIQVEAHLGLKGDQILYVGDHIFSDVHVSKNILRWRTALILRDLEKEIAAIVAQEAGDLKIAELMADKEQIEHSLAHERLESQRRKRGYGPPVQSAQQDLRRRISALNTRMRRIDDELTRLIRAQAEKVGSPWGLLMRTGNDKSHLARQIERYADIYTSRVSNLGAVTPFGFLRSPRTNLPHDPDWD